MTERVNIRELALETLLAVGRDGEKSHQVIRNVLEKYQYLPRQERAFLPGSVKEPWNTGSGWIIFWTLFPGLRRPG